MRRILHALQQRGRRRRHNHFRLRSDRFDDDLTVRTHTATAGIAYKFFYPESDSKADIGLMRYGYTPAPVRLR
jgi:hypothetical protein